MPEEKMTAAKSAPAAGMNDESKLFAALSYVLTVLSGIVIYLMKKDDKYVKFHAMQSILFGIVVFVVMIGLGIVGLVVGLIPAIGWIIGLVLGLVQLVLSLGVFVVWLLLMWKAYNGEKYKLPLIGAQAEKMAGA